jgi:hypothetical protein
MFQRDMINLRDETINFLTLYGKGVTDVSWIGTNEWCLSWEEAQTILDVEYDAGYGTQQINPALIVILNDGSWLKRWEYDGSEGWTYTEVPKQPKHGTFSITY